MSDPYTQDLDRQIAEARSQREALRDLAKTDPIAALVVKRMDEAEAKFHDQFAKNLF